MKIIENLERLQAEEFAACRARNETPVSKIVVPLVQDLNNFLHLVRKPSHTSSNLDLGTLASWCLERNICPEENMPDEPFVVDYNIFFPDDLPENRRLRGFTIN
jgi:hypothetical protein